MPRSLNQWLEAIYQVHKSEIELGLGRITQVAEILDCLQFTCPVIKVAGSNGKGTTTACLSHIYQQAGYTVATYTSPHLIRFNERICLNHQPVSDTVLCQQFECIEAARGDIKLTFFEYTTLAALLVFQQQQPDVVILEIGLGGRLDAVNCVRGDCAIVTSISLEHQQWLGDTRAAIAEEKAAIVNAGSPLICGDLEPPAEVKQVADVVASPSFFIKQDYFYSEEDEHWDWWTVNKRIDALPKLHIPKQNAATALMAVEIMQAKLPVNDAAIIAGCEQTQVPGRLQVFTKPCPIILDVAHNPAACQYLAEQIQLQDPCPGQRWCIFSILHDKDWRGAIEPLMALVDHWVVTSVADPRASDSQQLAQTIRDLNPEAMIHFQDNPAAALHWVIDSRQPSDHLLVFGSFAVVGGVLAQLL